MDDGKVYVPPIKIQGIKTKIVPLIKAKVRLNADTVWIEPFMGSGVVGFNINPQKAVFADINPHIIRFYQQIQNGEINARVVRDFLENEGKILEQKGEEHYYFIRERFNNAPNSLDFLFLNRACFNGMIRFNKKYRFNVPFGHKPQRFAKAYVTKIVNQVKYLEELMPEREWTFLCQSYESTIAQAQAESFIYCDPPYIGRHVDYFDSWDEIAEVALRDSLLEKNAKFMLSTWDYNQYRQNEYIEKVWGFCSKINKEHFYHVGARETNRQPMVEALLTNYTFPK